MKSAKKGAKKEKNKKNPWGLIIIIVLISLGLCCISIPVAWYLYNYFSQPTVKQYVDATEQNYTDANSEVEYLNSEIDYVFESAWEEGYDDRIDHFEEIEISARTLLTKINEAEGQMPTEMPTTDEVVNLDSDLNEYYKSARIFGGDYQEFVTYYIEYLEWEVEWNKLDEEYGGKLISPRDSKEDVENNLTITQQRMADSDDLLDRLDAMDVPDIAQDHFSIAFDFAEAYYELLDDWEAIYKKELAAYENESDVLMVEAGMMSDEANETYSQVTIELAEDMSQYKSGQSSSFKTQYQDLSELAKKIGALFEELGS